MRKLALPQPGFDITAIALLIALTLAAWLMSGCQSIEKIAHYAEAMQEQAEKAGAELREAGEALEAAHAEYVKALEEGDGDQIAAALAAVQKADAERKARELDFSETQKTAELARMQLEEAKASGDYVEGVIGLIIGALTGGLGGGLLGRRKKQPATP
jgi:hypothetical protein